METQEVKRETPVSSLSEASVNLMRELQKQISEDIRGRKDTPFQVWALYWMLNYVNSTGSSKEKEVYLMAIHGNLDGLKAFCPREIVA